MGEPADAAPENVSATAAMPLPDLLPAWLVAIWIAALLVVVIFHCGHLAHKGGQNRWYHCAHIVMLLGMIYMFASMAVGRAPIPAALWTTAYVGISLALMIWMVDRFLRREPFSYLWVLTLIQQVAMIYMFLPAERWHISITVVWILYFAVEAVAWLIGWCGERPRREGIAIGAGDPRLVTSIGHTTLTGSIAMAIMPASMSYMFLAMGAFS